MARNPLRHTLRPILETGDDMSMPQNPWPRHFSQMGFRFDMRER
jgi:hypothetical protein